MQQRLPSLLDPPISFAHRGARAYAPENTIEAFELALRLGATGLESDVWLTSDGVPVLDHYGQIRSKMRRRPIGELPHSALPAHIPSVADLLDACGTEYELSLDLKDPAAAIPTIDVVRSRDREMTRRIWLCDPAIDHLVELRAALPDVRLVNTTRIEQIKEGPERRAARLAGEAIDAVNMRRTDWNGGLVTLFHRFDLLAFCWDLQQEHHLRESFRMGIDAVYSDHPDVMRDALGAEEGAS